jgi:predicted DCC family thiol-disulfide oxidoreductase YuxK
MQGEPAQKLTCYYDGKCPMCSAIMGGVLQSDAADRFAARDMHRPGKLPFERSAIEKEIHVTDGAGNVYRGADAVLKIAEQFPRYRVLTRLARLPPARIASPVVYGFVAANRRFLLGPASRLYWLKMTLAIVVATGLVMSRHLWIGPRSYPLAPVLDMLPALDNRLAVAMYAGMFVLLLGTMLSARPQRFIGGLLAFIGTFCLFDQTRWQPWLFQYVFLLGALALYSWDATDKKGLARTLNIARLIIAATYVYSGLQKFNLNFADHDFPWIVQPITQIVPQLTGPLHLFGFVAPALQVGFGLGLLTRRFRKVSLILAVSMHVFILAMFGPLGLDWNSIIWPWTAAMILFDFLLFGGKVDAGPREILFPSRSPYHWAVLLLFAILPLASFFNLWDSYLSAALYSGNLTDAQIYLSDAGAAALPKDIRRFAVHSSADTNVINLQHWAIDDLNETPYPEARVYKALARSVCALLPDPAQLVLIVHEQRLYGSRPETGYRCWTL